MQPHDFWQEIFPANSFVTDKGHSDFFPVTLDDGRQIQLPIRPLADGEHALASLIINQASFAVMQALTDDLAEKLAPYQPEIVVGLPTLGLTLAANVAHKLGHSRYVPLGTSRKFWYDETLSVPLSSITTVGQQKRLYVDPRMLPLIKGKRIALIDDAISSGTSIKAALELLLGLDIEPVVIGAAMLQSKRWEKLLDELGSQWPARVAGCFYSPILKKGADGLWHISDR